MRLALAMTTVIPLFLSTAASSATIMRTTTIVPSVVGARVYMGRGAIEPLQVEVGDTLDLTILLDQPASLTITDTDRLGMFVHFLGGRPDNLFQPSGRADITFQLLDPAGSIKSSGGPDTSVFRSFFGNSYFNLRQAGSGGTVGLSGVRLIYDITQEATGTVHTVQFGFYSQPRGHVPVPEPATWMMMVSGFGLIGASARRHTRSAVTYA